MIVLIIVGVLQERASHKVVYGIPKSANLRKGLVLVLNPPKLGIYNLAGGHIAIFQHCRNIKLKNLVPLLNQNLLRERVGRDIRNGIDKDTLCCLVGLVGYPDKVLALLFKRITHWEIWGTAILLTYKFPEGALLVFLGVSDYPVALRLVYSAI